MFENQQKEVETLMAQNEEFRTLLKRHKELNKKVESAELGTLPMDDVTLARMKKEKLWAKDRLTQMFESHLAPSAG